MSFQIDLNLPDIETLGFRINECGEYHIEVRSTKNSCLCKNCCSEIDQFHGYDEAILLRHLSILGKKTFLELRPKRFVCNHCSGHPTTTQVLSWYTIRCSTTYEYEKHLLNHLVNSTIRDIEIKEKIEYETIVRIINQYFP